MNIETSYATNLAARGVNFAPEIVSAALRHGIDPRLLAAVAAQETGGPGATGGRNIVGDGGHGHGVFQIDDRWHAFARTASAMDPHENADYAARMIADLLRRYDGDVHKALSSYNAGNPDATGTTTRWKDGKVLGYADSVLRHAQALGTAIEFAHANVADTSCSVNSLLQFAQSPERYLDKHQPAREKQTDYASLLFEE